MSSYIFNVIACMDFLFRYLRMWIFVLCSPFNLIQFNSIHILSVNIWKQFLKQMIFVFFYIHMWALIRLWLIRVRVSYQMDSIRIECGSILIAVMSGWTIIIIIIFIWLMFILAFICIECSKTFGAFFDLRRNVDRSNRIVSTNSTSVEIHFEKREKKTFRFDDSNVRWFLR